MKIFLTLVASLIICLNSESITIECELYPGSIPDEFEVVIGEKDELVTFEVKYSRFWQITTDSSNRIDSIFSVPYNLQNYIEIRDEKRLISRSPVGLKFLGKNPGYYFEVTRDFLEFSKFTLIIHATNGTLAADIFWFNLKKIYDGLRTIEEEKK